LYFLNFPPKKQIPFYPVLPFFALFNWTFSPVFRRLLIAAPTCLDRYKAKFGVRGFVVALNKQKVTPRNYTDAVKSDVHWKHPFACTCVRRIRDSRKDRYRLLADCDSQRRGQRRRVIQREIVDALQRHQRTSVTTDLRASRCSPQRKIRALPEMRSTLSRNVSPRNLPH